MEARGAEARSGLDLARHHQHAAALQVRGGLQMDPQGRSIFPKQGEQLVLRKHLSIRKPFLHTSSVAAAAWRKSVLCCSHWASSAPS